KLYENKDGDALFINSNSASEAKLNPTQDAMAMEGADSPSPNIIAVRKRAEKKKESNELGEVLHSKEIQDFINKEYKGAVLPVSE
ncbi:methionine ABC transporter substrate-binding lipoprotein MetQ, partial [Bacillus cereus]|nr:methionine ABC transporter substrate-binding lipoprotein MetQ [Bacillus cereus]